MKNNKLIDLGRKHGAYSFPLLASNSAKEQNDPPIQYGLFLRIFLFFFLLSLFIFFLSILLGQRSEIGMEGIFFHFLRHLIAMFFLSLLVFFLLRRMFQPLRALIKGVTEISNGNLDHEVSIKSYHGEITYLAEKFNQMARKVKEMVQSKEELLLDVSHELRSPLARLKLALEMPPSEKMRESMLQNIAKMDLMLNELLETQRLKSGYGRITLSKVDLTGLIEQIVKQYQNRLPRIKILRNPGPLLIEIDETRIENVFQNVFENALKYSFSRKKPIQVKFNATPNLITVGIRDFGQGIPLKEQKKVFEPFYRVNKYHEKKIGGYGLGLSLCREIMRAHDGNIKLWSEPKKGTEIILEFQKKIKG